MNTTDTTIQDDLKRLGYALGDLIDSVDMPTQVKDVFVELVPHLNPEQLEELYKSLKKTFIEQRVVEMDPEYQSLAVMVDEQTADQLEAISNEIDT